MAGGTAGLAVFSRGVVLVVDGAGRVGAERDVGLRPAKELVYVLDRRLRQQGCGSGAHSSAVIKFLSVLTKHTGVSCNRQVEPAKDWKSDCLGKQSRLVVELCGVLGRLHSNQVLAQSNNNAKLNNSAKHVIKAARNKV